MISELVKLPASTCSVKPPSFFGHGRVFKVHVLALCDLIVHILCHLEGEFLITETQVFGWDETSKEDVDTFTDTERHGHNTVGTGAAVQTADVIRQVVQY
jgi:hypothetical protein